jgi:acyl-CoA dehydrogenase
MKKEPNQPTAWNETLSPEQASFTDAARRALQPLRTRLSNVHEAERRTGEAFAEVWKCLSEIGWFGCLIPEEFGGNERGMVAMAIAYEELAKQGILTTFPVLTALSAACIARFGNATLRQHILPRIAKGEAKICVSATEETTGFNLFGITTFAKKECDHYLISGSKTYASGFDVADYALVVTRTTSLEECEKLGLPKTVGLSLFLVDTRAAGISKVPLNTRGEGVIKQFKVYFLNVKAPAEGLIGKENEGASALFFSFNIERVLFAAGVLGTSQFCLEVACEHARNRRVFGDTPIGQYQAIQHPLADVKIRQEAVRLMTYRTARAIDQGEDPSKLLVLANSTKYLASELGLKAVDAALEALGGKGFDQDTGIIQLWETMRLLKLSPISNSLILNDIAERVLNLPRSR